MQGNTMGDVYVYDAAAGTRLAQVAPIKVSQHTRPTRSSICLLRIVCSTWCQEIDIEGVLLVLLLR